MPEEMPGSKETRSCSVTQLLSSSQYRQMISAARMFKPGTIARDGQSSFIAHLSVGIGPRTRQPARPGTQRRANHASQKPHFDNPPHPGGGEEQHHDQKYSNRPVTYHRNSTSTICQTKAIAKNSTTSNIKTRNAASLICLPIQTFGDVLG